MCNKVERWLPFIGNFPIISIKVRSKGGSSPVYLSPDEGGGIENAELKMFNS
jgi:hypothetical protein